MSLPSKPNRSSVVVFKPQEALSRDAKADAIIEFAKKTKDWPTLEAAVDEKIEDQKAFVVWWGSNVRRAGGPKKNSPGPAGILCEDAEEITGITNQQVSKWRKKLSDIHKYREALYGVAWKKAMCEEHNHRAEGTGENEWYTPEKYLVLARKVMGSIDLDPATSEKAQETVKAKKCFTINDNGLNQPWEGNVWLNPPYAQPHIANFIEKMVSEFNGGEVKSAIVLTHNYTDTTWFHRAASAASAICFTRGRIKFLDESGGTCAPTQGQAFFYFGPDSVTFMSIFSEIGLVVAPFHGEI